MSSSPPRVLPKCTFSTACARWMVYDLPSQLRALLLSSLGQPVCMESLLGRWRGAISFGRRSGLWARPEEGGYKRAWPRVQGTLAPRADCCPPGPASCGEMWPLRPKEHPLRAVGGTLAGLAGSLTV